MNDAEAGTSGGTVRVTEDFDVFLNHRGPDVKATFVAHLEDGLRCAGFCPFLDARSLMKGNPALQSIDQALDMAKVHVAVVSRGYAESKYCLNELVAIMRSGKPVVPVFYGVEPGELRRVEDGPFAEAFEKHQRRGRTEKRMQEWRDALCALAGLTGFRLADYKSEAKLKRDVLEEVARLTPSNRPIEVAPYVVGLKGPTKTCVELLDSVGDGVGILGLVGTGGVGKTTLARVIYNHYVAQQKFRCMTFLEVHKSPSSTDVQVRPMLCNNLREQLLWDLLRVHDCTSNYDLWFKKLAELGPVLIVIDDVHKLGQFEALIPSASFLHSGSRIIITSRDCNILNNAMGRSKVHCQAYNVSTLASEEANVLFNWHAFNVEEAPKDYKDVAQEVVKACGGLPLALKVMGCHLYDKRSDGDRETIWGEAINVLRRSKDIMDVLKWSYDDLAEEDKLMFLDITCMFYDKTVEEAMACWKGCKDTCCGDLCTLHTSLRNLVDKSLVVVQVVYKGNIGVHDLWRDLGQQIAMKMRRHCLDHRVLHRARSEKEASMDTIGVNLEGSRKRKFKVSNFARLPNLHYLRLPDGCHVNGNFGSFPKKMRLLQWRGMPLSIMPMELNMKYMVSLDFSHSPNLDFMCSSSSDSLKMCRNLVELNLSWCKSITKLRDFIGHLPRLKRLYLNNCPKLKKVPDSVGQLKELEELNIRNCTSLEALPATMTNPNLRILDLFFCESISKLPNSIGQLLALQELRLTGCSSLECLPDTIGALSNLTFFSTWKCKSMVTIPTSTKLLSNLKVLFITSRAMSQPLVDGNIGGEWTQLRELMLDNWDGIGSHLDYGALQSLEVLELHDDIVIELPDSIGLLVHLRELTIKCERLQSLPESIGDLEELESLRLENCSNLRRLPKSLGALTGLVTLSISSCCHIKKLPKSLGRLLNLVHLELNQCKNLQELPTSIIQLESLKTIEIVNCGSIEALAALTTLQGHPLWGSTSITNLPTFLGTISNFYVCASIEDYYEYISDTHEFASAYQTLEEDESGFLRVYQSSGVTRLLRCSHKESTPSQMA